MISLFRLARQAPELWIRAGKAVPVRMDQHFREELPSELLKREVGFSGVARPAGGNEVVEILPAAAAGPRLDVVEARADQ